MEVHGFILVGDSKKPHSSRNECGFFELIGKEEDKLKEFAQELFLDYLARTDNFNRSSDERPVFMLDWFTSRFFQSSSNVSRIRPAILTELKKEYDEPVAEKYRWLARYYNRTIFLEEGHSEMKIEEELQ